MLLILSAILNVTPFPLIAYRVLRLSTIFSSAMSWSIQSTYYSLNIKISVHYKFKLVDGVKMFLEGSDSNLFVLIAELNICRLTWCFVRQELGDVRR